MGSLKDLSSVSINKHLLLSTSGKIDIYVHDTLKKTYNASIDSIYKIESKQDYNSMLELVSIQPYLSDKWVFEIDYKKVKKFIFNKIGIFESETSCFCFLVQNYREFKEVKKELKECNDLYLPIIRRADSMFMMEGLEVSEKIKSFVATSYSRDPECVFTFCENIRNGMEVNSQKDVVKMLGASSGSVVNFAMLLLADPPTTERGLKMVYRKRVQLGHDLCNAYGCSSFRNFLSSTIYDLLQIKILYLQGVIYDKVKGIPEQFDEKKLSKYSFQLDRVINNVSYEKLAKLYCMLQEKDNKVWYTPNNMVEFIYKYYGGVTDGIIGKL